MHPVSSTSTDYNGYAVTPKACKRSNLPLQDPNPDYDVGATHFVRFEVMMVDHKNVVVTDRIDLRGFGLVSSIRRAFHGHFN